MKPTAFCLTLTLLAASAALMAQTTTAPQDLQDPTFNPREGITPTSMKVPDKKPPFPKPFSQIAVSGGIGAMGINMQVATNANKYMNVRGVGNYFTYTMNNTVIDSYTVNGQLNFATGGASVDFYPFPSHGFRLSPGVMFYNDNAASANVTVAGGTKLSLNDIDYYSSTSNPIKGNGSIGLNTQNPTFTITTGWGNMIRRGSGHWSFPFELGAAMIGTPAINVALTSGQACDVHGANCVNVATDPTVQANLKAQIAKYKNDLDLLRFYPILTFGVAYSFHIR